MEKYTVIKYKDQYGYIDIPSRVVKNTANMKTGECYEIKSLNKVIMSDGSISMLMDSDMEVIDNDRSRKFIKEVNKLYDE